MKIKLTLGGAENVALVLPVEAGAHLAAILGGATVHESSGWGPDAKWNVCERQVTIAYVDGAEFLPNPRAERAEKRAEQQSSDWLAEYHKRGAAEAEVAALKEQVAALTARLEGMIAATPGADS